MIKGILRKSATGWCLYGLYLLLTVIHPLIFWVAARIKPNFESNEDWKYLDNVSWDSSEPEQVVVVWLCTAVACGVVAGAYFGLTALCEYIWTTEESEE